MTCNFCIIRENPLEMSNYVLNDALVVTLLDSEKKILMSLITEKIM